MIINQKNFDRLLIDFIVSLNFSFCAVENSYFRKLMDFLISNLSVELFDRITANVKMKKLYYSEWKHLLNDFSSDNKIFLAVDDWTSPNYFEFVVIRVYFISHEWTLQKRLINFENLRNVHTKTNYAEIIIKTLHDYQFTNQLLTITIDNAANNQTMREKVKNELQKIDIEWNHLANTISCMTHVIQLVVKTLLNGLKIKKPIASSKNDLINAFKTLKQDLESLNFANIIFKIVIYFCHLFWYYYWFLCDKCENSPSSSNLLLNDWKNLENIINQILNLNQFRCKMLTHVEISLITCSYKSCICENKYMFLFIRISILSSRVFDYRKMKFNILIISSIFWSHLKIKPWSYFKKTKLILMKLDSFIILFSMKWKNLFRFWFQTRRLISSSVNLSMWLKKHHKNWWFIMKKWQKSVNEFIILFAF